MDNSKTVMTTIMVLAVLSMCGTVAAQTSPSEAPEAASAMDPHAKHKAMMHMQHDAKSSAADVELRDLVLLTQDGEPVHFASDIVADHIVVMDFVYTTCTTICPVLSAILGQVQSGLDEREDADVRIVSVSVDPGRDTPERIKAYADKHHAGPNWLWLTGEKTSVDDVLRGLGTYTPDFEDHPSIVLVGDPRSGKWTRFFGFPGKDKILAAVDTLIAARQNQ